MFAKNIKYRFIVNIIMEFNVFFYACLKDKWPNCLNKQGPS